MLRWAFKGPRQFQDVPGLARFLLAAVLVAPAVGATIGALNVVVHAVPQTYWRTWIEWFMSNALTALTILPGAACSARRTSRGYTDRA